MTITATDYHRATSYDRNSMSGHILDWSNQPSLFKSYVGQKLISLPDDHSFSSASLWEILSQKIRSQHSNDIDLALLARVLVLTHTITAKARYGGVDFFYRSVASAGALYPFELYVAVLNVDGLSPGLYHHQPFTRSLAVLRHGCPDEELSELIPGMSPPATSVVFFISSIFFRSSWKYRERAYRYHLLDSGHLLENLTLALKSEALSYRLAMDFEDIAVNKFLGFDQEREACLAVVTVAGGDCRANLTAELPLDPPGPHLPVCSRVSPRETLYESIKDIHLASSVLKSPVMRPDVSKELGITVDSWLKAAPTQLSSEIMNLPEALIKRRSMRNFVRSGLSMDRLSLLLATICSDYTTCENGGAAGKECVEVGFLAENIHGLKAGFYMINRRNNSYGIVKPGFFIGTMAHVALDQQWLANSSLHFLFLTNIKVIEAAYGPRGYRYAMLQAGRLGQRLYLAATSIRLGCCGIGAFYDSEASELLGLNKDSSLLYLVAVGAVRKFLQPRSVDRV